MATAKTRPAAPPIVVHLEDNRGSRLWLRFLPAALLSGVFHAALIFLLVLLMSGSGQAEPATEEIIETKVMADTPPPPEKKDPFLTTDIDPAAQEFDTDIQYAVDRKAEVSVPGMVDPTEAVGILDGDMSKPPTNLPAPGGFGGMGQGGTIEGAIGTSNAVGQLGGYGPKGMPLAGTFYGRSGATREWALRNGGGTGETEACVTRGLTWLARVQAPDGSWRLDDPRFKDRGQSNDIAGTAFGLLPFLGAGKTHKKSQDNPYDKPIERALYFLIRKMDKRTGNFGGGMYAHGLATIAICEAYGLTQDQNLRRYAQMAVNYIVLAQHDGGGWRYAPRQPGDTSVAAWHMQALKSAQMAGLDVPDLTFKKAIRFLDSVQGPRGGYGYTGPGDSPTLTAAGLLCRQYLQSWGPKNPNLQRGVQIVQATGPTIQNMYFSYYATQVMHHYGGETWTNWNNKMRKLLVDSQDKSPDPLRNGSWQTTAGGHLTAGGRLMMTSLCMLTLEVYYRHLPLYFREAVAAKDGLIK